MSDSSNSMSRRGLFRALVRPFSQHVGGEDDQSEASDLRGEDEGEASSEPVAMEAVIQGRFCLAYQGGICFTCSERCPVPGAITTKLGIPTVHRDLCTGCSICHDLCPAPRNAILMLEKKEAVLADVGHRA